MYAAAFTADLAAQRQREITAEVRRARLAHAVRAAGRSRPSLVHRLLTSRNSLHQVLAASTVEDGRTTPQLSVPAA